MDSLANARRVRIEAQFYQDGARIFEFFVADLPQQFIEREREEAARKERAREEMRLRAEAAVRAGQQKLIDDWRARIQTKIKDRIVVPSNIQGNPEARFEVVLLPGGEVLSASLKKSSGNAAYDAAVERAIMAAQPLPVPNEADLFDQSFREFPLVFRPKDKD